MKQIDQDQINQVAWNACDTFRGTIDPAQYKDYILVTLFLKYLSDVWLDKKEEYEKEFKGDAERAKRRLARERFILPDGCDFYTLYGKRSEANIGELINVALEQIEDANKTKLEGVFRNIDFNSEANLGQTKERNKRLKSLLEKFAVEELDLRPSRVGKQDIIGNTYQYLIGHFASDAGKKGGEFYTPGEVSELLAKLLAPKKGSRICDPTCGSGSLLIQVGDEVGDNDFSLYGQEMNGSTWALCRMNMLVHNKDAARIEWGDTINNPKLIERDSLMKFDIVVANPPFSLADWGADSADADKFHRFHRGVPPKSKGDYAFISHMVETAIEGTGKVGVIAPHGVLFRGGAEERIRKAFIEENVLEAVIGLPEKLFFGTGIPAVILIFNKGKNTKDVLFIDASREFVEDTNQNKLSQDHITKIVATYAAFKTVDKYAYRATPEQIDENDFNLNIPRYVDTFEPEKPVNLKAVQNDIDDLEIELARVRKQMAGYLKELGL
ncbi:type I restriction-modification system subunit M [Pedosphaera parvula]|uniref:site-specific DNA-methyltransferase (adenine-specific) n=1 Tax=Pedosphaera parvula (strain Ellin514) TaxID=320771 RepID=B9XT15_PEDPL|nr:type I restriction-modification system subunit M [Pedosphaera parvula]EEF57025.1 type I restriction-modification system, M subunit [Pedosphaera parvula Ellin514]